VWKQFDEWNSHDLVERLRERRHLSEDGHIHVGLAAAVSTELNGPPLWLMLIGVPSSGKTDMTDALRTLAFHVDDVTLAGLISWSDRKKTCKGGILGKVGRRGFITIGDFSTVLAKSERGDHDDIFSALRRIYDGSYTREIHPKALEWEGRVTIIANCTAAIDRYSSYNAALGDRWILYRLPKVDRPDKLSMQQKAILKYDKQWLDDVRELATMVVTNAVAKARSIEVPTRITNQVFNLVAVTALGRAAVPRSRFGNRDIEDLPIIEELPRLTQQIHMLAKCLFSLELGEDHVASLVRRCALDSMPAKRLAVLSVMTAAHRSGETLPVSEVARRAGLHRHVARMTLEDFEAIGLTTSDESDTIEEHNPKSRTARLWYLDGPDTDLVVSVMSGSR
jgi:hypothetical protein